MIPSAFIAFYRSLARHPLHSALNVLGLSLGIAVFIIISLFVRFETSFDQWLRHADGIYEVGATRLGQTTDPRPRFRSNAATYNAVRHVMPYLPATRVVPSYSFLRRSSEVHEEEGQFVDADFFRVFDLPFVAGDAANALRPDGIVLSEAMARKYFGRSDAVGHTLTLYDDTTALAEFSAGTRHAKTYFVTGVVKNAPANATFRFDLIRLFTGDPASTQPQWNSWDYFAGRTFFRFETPADAAALDSKLDGILDGYGEAKFLDSEIRTPRHDVLRLRLTPLVAEHLSEPKAMVALVALGMVGGLALLVALINHVNLATARSGVRAREVAVRKALGATLGGLRRQFLAEALIVSLSAAVIGLSLVELGLPAINAAGGLALRLDYVREAPWLIAVLAAVLLSGIVAGLYPAFVLSAFKPVTVLSAVRPRAPQIGDQVVREGLVIAQFAVVTALLIVVLGFATQLRHMETSNLGFPREQLLITNSTINSRFSTDQIEALEDSWRALPNVVSVSNGSIPGRYFMFARFPVHRDATPTKAVEVKGIFVDDGYFATYGTSVLAGRSLTKSDYSDADVMAAFKRPFAIPVDINSSAVTALGFASPGDAVNARLLREQTSFVVVGVVADQRLAAPTVKMGPAVYFTSPMVKSHYSTLVRYDGVGEAAIMARLKPAWQALAPDMPLVFETVGKTLDFYYENDRRNTNLFLLGAIAAGVIGGLGLFGIAAATTSSRQFEIGVRKALGASRQRVLRLLVGQFLRPVLLANLIAWPVAWIALARWLDQFDDRISVEVWFFAAGSLVSLLIAVATVAGLAFVTASASPAEVLRYE